MYDIWVYATTKFIAEIPILLAVPFIFISLLYFAIGFEDSLTEFVKFYLILALMIQAACAMGYGLSSMFNEVTAAVAFAPMINMPLNLLGGYMISLSDIWDHSP